MPIRLRLTIVFALGMAVLLAGLGAFVYARQSADLIGAVDMGLRSRAQALTDTIANGRDADLNRSGVALIDPDEAFAQILAPAGDILDASQAVEDAPLLPVTAFGAGPEPVFVTATIEGFDDPVRLLAATVGGGANGAPEGSSTPAYIIVGATLGDTTEAIQGLVTLLLVVGSLALVATTLAGWVLAGAALRPVERMRREAAAISASEPGRRLEVPHTRDELARLATTINEMLDRLQETLERERRFVDDASHELRTPLATLRGEIDLALARPRSGDELESSLWSALEDVVRLQRLADDLLVLARSRGGRIPVRRVPTPLLGLLERGVRAVATTGREAGVGVAVEAPADAVDVDPERVEQAVRNLLENAIRHSPPGGTVRLSGTRSDGWVRIVVEDAGAGVPARAPRRRVRPVRHRGRAGRGRRPQRRRAGTRDRQGRGGGPRRHGLGRERPRGRPGGDGPAGLRSSRPGVESRGERL